MIKINEKHLPGRSPHGYKVAPVSKLDLRRDSDAIRKILKEEGCYKGGYFINIDKLLEKTLRQVGYEPHIIGDDQLPGIAAYTDPTKKLIVMRQSVYDGLSYDDPFSRFTVIHEFSHIFLCHGQTFHRDTVNGAHKWYEDSEWQANNLAAEIMMPVEIFRDFGRESSLIMQICGVGSQAVECRMKNLRKEGILEKRSSLL